MGVSGCFEGVSRETALNRWRHGLEVFHVKQRGVLVGLAVGAVNGWGGVFVHPFPLNSVETKSR